MKSLILAMSVCAVCSAAVAQNKIPSGFYKSVGSEKVSVPLVQKTDLTVEKLSVTYFATYASELKSEILQCIQDAPAYAIDRQKAFRTINDKRAIGDWKFALQDCWLFVNTLHKNPPLKSGPDYYLFDSLGQLQQEGLLPKEIISRPMPGARELIREDEGPFFRTVSVFHASGF